MRHVHGPALVALRLLAAGILVAGVPAASHHSVGSIALASGPASSVQGWQNYKSPAGQYAVLMPCSPSVETRPTETDLGPIAMQMASCTTSALFATVIYYDVPMKIATTPETFLKDTADAFMKGGGFVEKASRQQIALDGHAGIEVIGESQDGQSVVQARYYLVRSRVYLVMVGTAVNDASSPDIGSFFASFKIG